MQVPKRKPGIYTNQESDPHLTPAKLDELKRELHRLKTVSRPQAILETKRLAEMGDFSENAEYQIAKGRLRGINNRIDELVDQIDRAVVIVPESTADVIAIGHTVIIEQDGEQKTFQILGSTESNPHLGIISYQSPLGAALIGKKIGDVFEVLLGKRNVSCRVIKIT
ncbi:MAG: GreA/GreB family elongation factor [Candidatus Kerfeldbacteria bacterium]|nr:GreA/GreB family elongation factor [Candidatus Kerfeldbacteria bacterium]